MLPKVAASSYCRQHLGEVGIKTIGVVDVVGGDCAGRFSSRATSHNRSLRGSSSGIRWSHSSMCSRRPKISRKTGQLLVAVFRVIAELCRPRHSPLPASGEGHQDRPWSPPSVRSSHRYTGRSFSPRICALGDQFAQLCVPLRRRCQHHEMIHGSRIDDLGAMAAPNPTSPPSRATPRPRTASWMYRFTRDASNGRS